MKKVKFYVFPLEKSAERRNKETKLPKEGVTKASPFQPQVGIASFTYDVNLDDVVRSYPHLRMRSCLLIHPPSSRWHSN